MTRLLDRISGWMRGAAPPDGGTRRDPRQAAPEGPAGPRGWSGGARGFAEAPLPGATRPDPARPGDPGPTGADRAPAPGWRGPPRADGLPFASTGPHGHRHRMREKLLERGPDALADYELLEMLLFFAFRTGDTKPLAKSLINRFGSFAGVLAAPQAALLATRGLGEHSVAAIKLVQAAAHRLARAEAMDGPVLNNAARLEAYLAGVMSREKVEQLRVLFLDPKNRLIADEVQGRGTVNHTPVYAREVVKRALELHATALILVHNHPSGDPTPSRADIEMTAEVREAAGLFGILLHDHIIVGNGRTCSFRAEGLIATR